MRMKKAGKQRRLTLGPPDEGGILPDHEGDADRTGQDSSPIRGRGQNITTTAGEGMKVAFMGSRGIPACYSGFETFYEQLGVRLAARGHDVTVYNRSNFVAYRGRSYRGVRLVRLPTLPSKHLDTIVHSFLSVLHGIFRRYDIVYFCGVGNSLLSGIPRAVGAKTVLNVDGADWRREKWGRLASAYLRFSERLACLFPSVVIADSRVVQGRYREQYGRETVFIPYGADTPRADGDEVLATFGLQAKRYVLFVGRLVPENAAHHLIEAFSRLETGMALAIVGDAPYSEDYKRRLRRMAGKNIVFTGYLFGESYRAISQHASFFVLPSRVDGTRPVLLDQMGFGNCVLVADSPGNLEVIGDAGLSFRGAEGSADLARQMEHLMRAPERRVEYGARARKRAQDHYDWEEITNQYEALFRQLTGGHE
jgi:glycosyltransferase involved in cell wall biosynthesis